MKTSHSQYRAKNDRLARESSCIFMVCPNDKKFSGKRLENNIRALKLANFKKITLLIANGNLRLSTLRVKNPSKPEHELVEIDSRETDSWIRRNKVLLEDNNKFEVKQWNHYIHDHRNYELFYNEIYDLFYIDIRFNSAMTKSIKAFLKRHYPNSAESIESKDPRWQNCFEYKIQEATGLLLKNHMKFDFLAYPGELCPALQYVFDKVLPTVTHHTMKFFQINPRSRIRNKLIEQAEVFSQQDTSDTLMEVGIVNNDPLLNELELKLQNATTYDEMQDYIAAIQTILTKYMLLMIHGKKSNGNTNQYSQVRIGSERKYEDNGVIYI